MDKSELKKKIDELMKERRGRVLDGNAFEALLSGLMNPLEGLYKLFVDRDKAIDDERQKIEQDLILELICKIEDSISELKSKVKDNFSGKSTIIWGEIEAYGENVDKVIGSHVTNGSGLVEFKPGSKIKASGKNARNVTGLQIGGGDN